MFPTFDSFRTVFNVVTQDFGCMVIVNRGARSSFTDKVFWFKASNQNIGMIGCKQFIEYHNNNYDDLWKKKNKKFDIMDLCGKKAANDKTLMVEKINDKKN